MGSHYIEPDDILMDNVVKITGYSLSTISKKTRIVEELRLVIKQYSSESNCDKKKLKIMKNFT